MKKVIFACLTVMTIMSSCGDSGPECEDDLSGTYVGTTTCLTSADATITITGEDGNYSVSGAYEESNPDQDGCVIKWDNSIAGIGNAYELTFSGNTLRLEETEKLTGLVFCVFEGTK